MSRVFRRRVERCRNGRRVTSTRQRRVVKVTASVKRRCDKCRVIKRHGVLLVICAEPKHKQRQG